MIARIGASLLALLTLLPVASAQTITEEDGRSVTMLFGSDLYRAGEHIIVEGAIADDVIAAGERVQVVGDVAGDVIAAGGRIEIEGNIADDLRVAGGDVTVAGGVAKDATIAGGTVHVTLPSTISGGVMIFGGNITIDGVIRGDLFIRGGNVRVNGRVGGNIDARGGTIILNGQVFGDAIMAGSTVDMGSNATIAGQLRYWQQDGEETFTGVAGGATYDAELSQQQPQQTRTFAAALLGIFTFFTIFSGALMIAFLMLMTRTFFVDSAKRLHAAPWMGLLWGFLYFAVTPILFILLLVTVIGIPIAAVVAATYLLSLLFAKTITAVVFAHWLQLRAKKKWHVGLLFLTALGIYVALKIISIIPFVGWILCAVLVLMGFGSYLQIKYERYKKIR